MEDPQKSLQLLSSAEELAEEILRDRSEIVALDRRRNHNREGLRALVNMKSKKCWLTLGPLLVRLPSDQAKDLLQDDQFSTETEINKLHSDIKVKVNKLRDIEYQDPVPGLSLNPLSKEELKAFTRVINRNS